MKRIILFLLVFFVASVVPVHAEYIWTQVNENGFGRGPYDGSEDFFALTVWDGCLYAGIEMTSGTEGAGVFRSCNGTSWVQVNTDGFGHMPNNDHIDSLAEYNGYFYASTGVQNSSFNGTEVFRTDNGTNWVQVDVSGFGSKNNENFKSMVVFNNMLCGGTWNQLVGAAVWCTSDGTDFVQKSLDGFGNSKNIVAWLLKVHGNYLYVAIQNNVQGVGVFRTSDLLNWEQVGINGLGYGAGLNYARPFTFAGNLYFMMKPAGSPIMIKEWAGGNTFNTVYTFSDSNLNPPSDLPIEYGGYSYGAFGYTSGGLKVLRSKDLINWEQISTQGYGTATNVYAQLSSLNGYLYAGVCDYTNGHKIFRLDVENFINNLPDNLIAVDMVNDQSINIVGPTGEGSFGAAESIRLTTSGGLVLSDIDVDLNLDRDWTSVSGTSELNNGRSFVTGLTGAPGAAASHILYIPIPPSLSSQYVTICPNATVIADVTHSCSSGVVFTNGESKNVGGADVTVTLTSINGINYWKAAGVTGTGGIAEFPLPTATVTPTARPVHRNPVTIIPTIEDTTAIETTPTITLTARVTKTPTPTLTPATEAGTQQQSTNWSWLICASLSLLLPLVIIAFFIRKRREENS